MQRDMLQKNLKTIRTYETNDKVLGPIDALMLAWQELYAAKHVVWHLFARDFLASFRQKLLGYVWIVILPLVSILSFVFMQKSGILRPGTMEISYPIFVYLGMTVWGLFMNTTTSVGNGLTTHSDLVVRTNIPKIALAVMGVATVYYNLLVNFIVLIFFLILTQQMPSPWIVLFPVAVLPAVILGLGIGLMLSVIGAVIRDATTLFTTVFTLVMYVTPVVYAAQFSQPLLQNIVRWNPLTYLVDAPRRLMMLGQINHVTGFFMATLFSVCVFLLGVYVFYLLKDKVAERL